MEDAAVAVDDDDIFGGWVGERGVEGKSAGLVVVSIDDTASHDDIYIKIGGGGEVTLLSTMTYILDKLKSEDHNK